MEKQKQKVTLSHLVVLAFVSVFVFAIGWYLGSNQGITVYMGGWESGQGVARPVKIKTIIPTDLPSEVPTETPTFVPTELPTAMPSVPSVMVPTVLPTAVSSVPSTAAPTELPIAL